jgi:predicted nucleotidyltransferase
MSASSSPSLSEVVGELRKQRTLLRDHGVRRLSVFGSLVRGEATPHSDIDLAIEHEPGREPSLGGFARLKNDLGELLGRRVDLVEWSTMRPSVKLEAERDAVEVF